MSEKITDEETKQLQHMIFTCKSKSEQFISLINQQTANENLLGYLKELAGKYGCDYKEIMASGDIVRIKEKAIDIQGEKVNVC